MNRREKEYKKQAQKDGWLVFHKGYPDFLLYKPQTNEALFVEIKSGLAKKTNQKGGELTDDQKNIHIILRSLGFTVKVVYID